MTLETYITDLLYRYDCVIVPDFGGFVANTKSATINVNTFSPPYKQITFNALLQNNDGLLANYIASKDKMPYETALNFIKFEVNEWNDKILYEDLELSGLGSLALIDQKIIFEPENKVNYLSASFGLGQFISEDILRDTAVPVLENKREIYKKEVANLEENAPIFLSTEKRRKTPNFIKYAAIFVLSASVFGVGSKLYQERIEKQQIVSINKQQKQQEAQIQTATFVIDSPLPTITLNTVVKAEKYHIIAGAFRNKANANKKVNQLTNKGFNAKVIGVNKWDLTQVAFNSYSTLEQANTALAIIKNTVAKDAWLLIK